MKIAHVVIENFRHIRRAELDFTDSLGRIRDLSLIVGPNTSGKTTILDALALTVGIGTEFPFTRPEFRLTPRSVRRGELYAKVTCEVRFSDDEVEATCELIRRAQETWTLPDSGIVRVAWQYPDPGRRSDMGFCRYEPYAGLSLFKARKKVVNLLPSGRASMDWFRRVGGIFIFDQQRTGLSKTISRDIMNIIRPGSSSEMDSLQTSDPREILLAEAVKAKFNQTNAFNLISEKYAEICHPHRIVGPIVDETGAYDLSFANDGVGEFLYDGLSSGEQMLLLFLIKMTTERIHRSVVLIDEIELHQHPLWQRKLLHLLPRIGEDNQIIATSHSPYLRGAISPEAVIELGPIEERTAAN